VIDISSCCCPEQEKWSPQPEAAFQNVAEHHLSDTRPRSVRLGMRHTRTVLRLTALRIAFPWAFWLYCYLRLALVSQSVGLLLERYHSSIFGYGTCARDHSTAYRPTFRAIITFGLLVAGRQRSHLAAVETSKRVGSRCIQSINQSVNRAYKTYSSRSIEHEDVGQRVGSWWHTGVAIIMG